MGAFALRAPATEREVLEALAGAPVGRVAVLAGGTDLLLDIDRRRLAPELLLSLRLLAWNAHRWDADRLIVGSTEPLARLEADPDLVGRLPALAQAIAAVGSSPLREQATLGGNLGRAAPASDLAPALLALDAEVELVSATGARRLPVDRFLRASRETALAPGELIREVVVAERRPTSAYVWQRVRPANDISQVGVAVAWSPGSRLWRVSLGGVPPRPVLAEPAAHALGGPWPSAHEIASAAEAFAGHPALVSDRRATEEYRRRLAGALLGRALRTAMGAARGAS